MVPMKKLLTKEDIVPYSFTSHKGTLSLIDEKGSNLLCWFTMILIMHL